jgi:hypothetical protein
MVPVIGVKRRPIKNPDRHPKGTHSFCASNAWRAPHRSWSGLTEAGRGWLACDRGSMSLQFLPPLVGGVRQNCRRRERMIYLECPENASFRDSDEIPHTKSNTQRSTPTIVYGTVPPARVENVKRRPREYLTVKEITKLIHGARERGRYGHRDATMILVG